MTTDNTKAEQSNAPDQQGRNEALVMRAAALLELLNSDFGMSGGIAFEAIMVELEAAYMDGIKEGYRDCRTLGNEFDRMHKMVASRYVAERIIAITDA